MTTYKDIGVTKAANFVGTIAERWKPSLFMN